LNKKLKVEERPSSHYKCTNRNKEYILEYKRSRQCEHCGFNEVPDILHFHHTFPEYKKFALSRYKHRSLKSIKEEIKKCILLCPNCHALEHYTRNDLLL